MDDTALEIAPGRAALEVARTLLARGQTLAAIPYIEQAMLLYPEAAGELMMEAEAQIHAIREVIDRAIVDDYCSSGRYALEWARRAGRTFPQIVAHMGSGLIHP